MKIKIPKKIFADILNQDFLKSFKFYQSELLWCNLYNLSLHEYTFDAVYLPLKIVDKLLATEYFKEVKCYCYFSGKMKNMLFSTTKYCKIGQRKFNIDLFYVNFNYLIMNWILTMSVWTKKSVEVFHSFERLDFSPSFHYDLRVLLEDLYMSSDSIKYQIYLLSENDEMYERILDDEFKAQTLKREIKKIQRSPKNFIQTLKKLLSSLNINYDISEKLKKFNLISLNRKYDEVSWIIKERNNLMHNYFNYCIENHFFVREDELSHKQFLIICFLIIDNLLMLYLLLDIFGYLC